MEKILYREPILFNNGAKITHVLGVGGNIGNDHYGEVQRQRWSSQGKWSIDLKPTLKRFLNNFGEISRLRISFNIKMTATSKQTAEDDHYINDKDKKLGATMDFFTDNIVKSLPYEKYTVDIFDKDCIFKYNAIFTIRNDVSSGKPAQGTGTLTIFNLIIDEIEYYPSYDPIQIVLKSNRNSFKYMSEDKIIFSYDIKDFKDNRLVSWKLYKKYQNNPIYIPLKPNYQGDLEFGLNEILATAPSSTYYIVAETEQQQAAKSNEVILQIIPGEAEMDITVSPQYLRYENIPQTVKGTATISNFGGISRDWAINKNINNNHSVLAIGNQSSGVLKKDFTDTVNPKNTIAPVSPNDVIKYGILCTNSIPVQSIYKDIPILEYNVDNMGIDGTIWKKINEHKVVIPPYVKKINNKKTLLEALKLEDSKLNMASKVEDYRILKWGGANVSANNTYMDGIIGTETPQQLFIINNDTEENRKTASRTIKYHMYLTRKDKEWDQSSMIFKDAAAPDSNFIVDGVSYANKIIPVTYRIDKLNNPTELKVFKTFATIDDDGETLKNRVEIKSNSQTYCYCGEQLYLEWISEEKPFAAIGGFTIEIYDIYSEKRLYTEEIDWNKVVQSSSAGRGHGYLFTIPKELENVGSCALNIVAINAYNNSIQNRQKDGFTWADSESGIANHFNNSFYLHITKKRQPLKVVAPIKTEENQDIYYFKYLRNPFLILKADSTFLDLNNSIMLPKFDPITNTIIGSGTPTINNDSGEIIGVQASPVDRIWYEITFGLPEYNWFDYWYPYQDLTWDEFKAKVIEILSNQIQNNLLYEKLKEEESQDKKGIDILQKQYSEIQDPEFELIWNYVINGCRNLWNAYLRQDIEHFSLLFGLWKDLYDWFEKYNRWEDFNVENDSWKYWKSVFKTWSKIFVDEELRKKIWQEYDIDNDNWDDWDKIYVIWKYVTKQQMPKRKWTVKFSLANDDDIIKLDENPHNLLGKQLILPSSMENYCFYNEYNDTIGIQFLSLYKDAFESYAPESNLYQLFKHKISQPNRKYTLEIRSAYGTADTIYQDTYSDTGVYTFISTDLIPQAKGIELDEITNSPIIQSGQIIYRDKYYKQVGSSLVQQSDVIKFGNKMAFLADLVNDICLYYDGLDSPINIFKQSGVYSYNEMAKAVAYGLKFAFNPYPQDLIHLDENKKPYHYIPATSLRQKWFDYYISNLNIQQDESQQKTNYTDEEVRTSIYNNSLFTKASVLQYLFNIIVDQ